MIEPHDQVYLGIGNWGVWTDWEGWRCLARGIGEEGRRLSGVVGRLPLYRMEGVDLPAI